MIRIPNSMFQPSKIEGRLGKVVVYALDRRTIGVTSKFENDWGSNCLYCKSWSVQREGSNWRLDLPDPIRKHYLIGMSPAKFLTGTNGGRILITIEDGSE